MFPKALSFIKSGILFIIISAVLITIIFCTIFENGNKLFSENYSKRMILGSDLSQTDCIALSHNMDECKLSIIQEELKHNEQNIKNNKKPEPSFFDNDLLETYKNSSVMDKVYGFDVCEAMYNENSVVLYTAYPETYELIRSGYQEETWFSNTDPDDKYPAAVLCGADFENVRIGDIISLKGYDSRFVTENNEKTVFQTRYLDSISIRVAGKIGFPYLSPDFSYRFIDSPFDIHYNKKAVIYLKHDEKTVSALRSAGLSVNPGNTFIYAGYRTDNVYRIEAFRKNVNEMEVSSDYDHRYPTIEESGNYIKKATEGFLPFFFDNMTNRDNISGTIAALILVFSTLTYISLRNRNIGEDDFYLKTSITSVIKYLIIMILIPALISGIIMTVHYIIQFSHNIDHGFSYIIGSLGSQYFISLLLFHLMVCIILIIVTLIPPLILFYYAKHTVKVTEKPPANDALEIFTGYENDDYYTEPWNQTQNNQPGA